MIRFNIPNVLGSEFTHLQNAITSRKLCGDGDYSYKCSNLLMEYLHTNGGVFLTHSCTAALEMAALLIDIKAGDEVIMPSYTFVSTANAFVLRGAVPVFVDISSKTLNINEKLIESAITEKTKAIVVVHYAGVSCEMDLISKIAQKHNLFVIEDAAQALGSSYKGRKVGTFGQFAAFSFHETKNIISGEGGALVVNDVNFLKRAEIIREKGTNRSLFYRGEVDKYTWVDVGSSFLPSELTAAFLFPQLQNIDHINSKRMVVWNRYFEAFKTFRCFKVPDVSTLCDHNAHIFYLIFENHELQKSYINFMKIFQINVVFHYIPLHNSPAGVKFTRTHGNLVVTNEIYDKIVRLPLHLDLSDAEIDFIIEKTIQFINRGEV